MSIRPARRATRDIVLAQGVLTITLVGIAFATTPILRMAIFSPIALFVAVLGDAATAIVLFETWRYSAQRPTFVLALSFVVVAILTLLTLLYLPTLPGAQPVLNGPPQAGAWLYISWHVAAAAGGIAFIALRKFGRSGIVSRRFAVAAVACASAFLLGGIAFVFGLGDRLPALVSGSSLAGFISTGIGPFAAILLAATTLLVFRIRNPTMLDRTLAISLLALALDIGLLLLGGQRWTVSFYASRLLIMLGGTFVLIAAMQSLVASRTRLSRVESQGARRAERIRALWQIATVSAGTTEERYRKMLEIASKTIRPGKAMFGGLSHLEGATVVMDALFSAASESAASAFSAAVYPGIRFPLESSIVSLLPADGSTQFWDDLRGVEGNESFRTRAVWQSLIGTQVAVGRRTFFVTFASTQTMTDEPFAEDDIAYVDVVASFIAGRVTEQTQFEQIQFEIEHDPLTGLENRVQFRDALREELETGRPCAIAFINLDGFRTVNERDGYQLGDDLLVAVAAGLTRVAGGDFVGRMGADEFGVLVRGADSLESTLSALGRYAEAFVRPFEVGQGDGALKLVVGASIGAARFPDDGASMQELMRRALVALGVAKTRAGSNSVIFDASMEAILEESHLRFVELSDAIAAGQLALVYQPTFELASRAIVGAEALVRWDHPVRGRLAPIEFIDFAERNGLMGPLSRWVLGQVARDLSGVRLPTGFRVYFNLGSAMLDDVAFVAHVSEVLRTNAGLAAHLGVEVTETAAMQNVERSVHTIELFRRWGLTVAIDDFGTGHSSLAYLKSLTVDVIKIDRSFITGLPEDDRDAALTEMLLRIIDRFAAVTLAEGIETEAQAAWLLAHGCRLGQGYLVGKPAPFDELLARLRPLRAA